MGEGAANFEFTLPLEPVLADYSLEIAGTRVFISVFRSFSLEFIFDLFWNRLRVKAFVHQMGS